MGDGRWGGGGTGRQEVGGQGLTQKSWLRRSSQARAGQNETTKDKSVAKDKRECGVLNHLSRSNDQIIDSLR